MRIRRRSIALLALVPTVFATWASAHMDEFEAPGPFMLEGRAIGGATPAAETPAYLTSSRIASVDRGALAIDADSGTLVRADHAGGLVAQLAIGRDAGLLAYDPVTRRAYVADRRGDRIAVVDVGDPVHGTLTLASSWKTPAEPYGVALTPDRATVLVTTIADRALVAFDAATGRERWRTALGKEPRGVAVSPNGARAIVGSLATGAVDEIDLATHEAVRTALPELFQPAIQRGAFAATFLGDDLAVVPFQRDVPAADDPDRGEAEGSYGGSFVPPITEHLAFVGVGGGRSRAVTAQINANQPRALAWDAAHDALYVAGMGTDSIIRIDHASQIDVELGATVELSKSLSPTGDERCGPDGLAITGDGVAVWCAFTRSIVQLGARGDEHRLAATMTIARGPTLVASALDATQHTGMVVFHTADPNISSFGVVACASCHLDGRTDGVSWRIHRQDLQTPLLAGRVAGTAPYKWDGDAKDLRASLVATVGRLGGGGLSKKHLAALGAYLESMPAVRTPTRDAATVARGRALFESGELGCGNCHDGAAYTDQSRHHFAGSLRASDTPSLVGLAASAPYFHDGSAATLENVLRDRGQVHGMAEAATALTDAQVADLSAFLETL